jgi:hypothetical protein
MNVRKEKGIGLITENGVENIVNSLAVYRKLAKEMTEVNEKYLTGNYMEVTRAWQKAVAETNQDIMEKIYQPYTQAGSTLLKESISGADVLKYWQLSIETPLLTPDKSFKGMEEFLLLCGKLQKNIWNLFSGWNDCIKMLTEADKTGIVFSLTPQQVCESWISTSEQFLEALAEVNIAFSKEWTEARINFLKAITSEDADTQSAGNRVKNKSARRKA